MHDTSGAWSDEEQRGTHPTLPYDLLPELADVIERQWREHKRLAAGGVLSPCVFKRQGERIRSIRGAWIAACEKVGCPRILPHDFRRTAVRNLVRVGVPEKIAMSITGHKTRSVFDRYAIVDEAMLREGAEKLTLHYEAQAKSERKVVPLDR